MGSMRRQLKTPGGTGGALRGRHRPVYAPRRRRAGSDDEAGVEVPHGAGVRDPERANGDARAAPGHKRRRVLGPDDRRTPRDGTRVGQGRARGLGGPNRADGRGDTARRDPGAGAVNMKRRLEALETGSTGSYWVTPVEVLVHTKSVERYQ